MNEVSATGHAKQAEVLIAWRLKLGDGRRETESLS